MASDPSLAQFAAANPVRVGSGAFMERIDPDIRGEVIASMMAGVTAGQVRRWLVQVKGFDPATTPKDNAIRDWFKSLAR